MTLCGISSRFQLLSPTERQVSHALLTRSPLSKNRSLYPVRLACVRHAASVRPEPGSNSQKVVSKLPKELKSKFWTIFASGKITQEFSLAVLIRSYTRTLKQIHYLSKVFKFVFTLFNLQGTVLVAFANQLLHFTTLSFICQELFSSFFKFLWSVSCHASLAEQLGYISTSFSICQELFSNSFKFLFDLHFFAALADSFDILSRQSPFVKLFFRLFSKKFRGLLRGPGHTILYPYSASSIRP